MVNRFECEKNRFSLIQNLTFSLLGNTSNGSPKKLKTFYFQGVWRGEGCCVFVDVFSLNIKEFSGALPQIGEACIIREAS